MGENLAVAIGLKVYSIYITRNGLEEKTTKLNPSGLQL
jgi:hypothetical protein